MVRSTQYEKLQKEVETSKDIGKSSKDKGIVPTSGVGTNAGKHEAEHSNKQVSDFLSSCIDQ